MDPTTRDLPAPPTAPRRRGRVVALGLAALLVIGGTTAAAVSMLSESPIAIEMAMPADADVAVLTSLEPPADQVANLLGIAARFPSLARGGDADGVLRDAIGRGLRDADLTVEDFAWVGPDIAFVGQVDPSADASAHQGALLLATDDEAAATETLRKAREGEGGWSASEHEGIEVWDGRDRAYAVHRGFAIIGSDRSMVVNVLDVMAGRSPALGASPAYTEVMELLPAQRLGAAFVNLPGLIEDLASRPDAAALTAQIADAKAVAGAGFSVSAEPDGLAFDAVVTYDPEKVSEELRAQLEAADVPSTLIGSVPRNAFAVFSQSGYATALAAALEGLGAGTTGMDDQLRLFGIAGPGGLLDALSGEVALEVGPGEPPAGSLLLATDDEEALQRALDRLLVEGPLPLGRVTRREVDGVSVTIVSVDRSFHIAYAVSGGRAVISSSVERLRQVLETDSGSGSIAADPAFSEAVDRVPNGGSTVYVEVGALVEALRAKMRPAERKAFDQRVGPVLEPFAAVVAGSEVDGLRQHSRLFVLLSNKE